MKRLFSVVAICLLIIGIGSPGYANPNAGNACYACHHSDAGALADPVIEYSPPDHSGYDALIASGAMNCASCHAAETKNPGDHSQYDAATVNCAGCHSGWEVTAPAIVDNDGDGSPSDEDCDDNDPARSPDFEEICGDGIDNDCDALIDGEDLQKCRDDDEDGYTIEDGDCKDDDPAIHPGAADGCDGIDNDCDGEIDEDQICGCLDGDTREATCGTGVCASTGIETCVNGEWANSTCVPGSPTDEICDGLDNDCDGQVDDGIAEQETTCGQGQCAATGVLACVNGEMVDTCRQGTPSEEVCDQIDNDCDGDVDEGLDCPCYAGDTRPVTCGQGECAATGIETCVEGEWADSTCVPGSPTDEICDGLDNDCNGKVDDGIADQPTTCGEGECAGTGVLTCVDGELVDTCEATCPEDPEDPIGCGDSTCPWNDKQEGTLTVTCRNFPENAAAVKVVLYPPGTAVSSRLARTIRDSEAFAIIKPDAGATLASADDHKTPATICGGRHRALVKVYYAKQFKGAMAATTVVIDGNSTLTLDYNELKFD